MRFDRCDQFFIWLYEFVNAFFLEALRYLFHVDTSCLDRCKDEIRFREIRFKGICDLTVVEKSIEGLDREGINGILSNQRFNIFCIGERRIFCAGARPQQSLGAGAAAEVDRRLKAGVGGAGRPARACAACRRTSTAG